MIRVAHNPSGLPIQTALLEVTLHDQNQTLRVPAGYGLEISQSLSTATEPGRITQNMTDREKTVTELIDALDELIDAIDRYHEELTQILESLGGKNDKLP